jgi:ABC-type multidrug transport system ATPase subunit
VSGGERRRVSIGVDIIHGPSLLFLDEPTSGLDSTSANSVIEKVHHIARSGSTVILTIHQPSSRIQLLLDHLIILARGQLMYQGSPKDVTLHLSRRGGVAAMVDIDTSPLDNRGGFIPVRANSASASTPSSD